jgi:hypothetical protein
MIIIFGTRFYGKTLEVPGVSFVKTKFFHIWYLPLIPVESWLVLEEKGDELRGVEIPMNGTSVLAGWRITAGIAALAFGLITVFNASDQLSVIVLGLLAAAMGVMALFWRPSPRATLEQSLALANGAAQKHPELAELLRNAYYEAAQVRAYQPQPQ